MAWPRSAPALRACCADRLSRGTIVPRGKAETGRPLYPPGPKSRAIGRVPARLMPFPGPARHPARHPGGVICRNPLPRFPVHVWRFNPITAMTAICPQPVPSDAGPRSRPASCPPPRRVDVPQPADPLSGPRLAVHPVAAMTVICPQPAASLPPAAGPRPDPTSCLPPRRGHMPKPASPVHDPDPTVHPNLARR